MLNRGGDFPNCDILSSWDYFFGRAHPKSTCYLVAARTLMSLRPKVFERTSNVPCLRALVPCGRSGIRTHMALRPIVFETIAYTVPPPAHNRDLPFHHRAVFGNCCKNALYSLDYIASKRASLASRGGT